MEKIISHSFSPFARWASRKQHLTQMVYHVGKPKSFLVRHFLICRNTIGLPFLT